MCRRARRRPAVRNAENRRRMTVVFRKARALTLDASFPDWQSIMRFLFLLLTVLFAAAPSLPMASPRIAIIYEGGESTGPAELRYALAQSSAPVQVDIYSPGLGGMVLPQDTDLHAYALVFIDGAAKGLPLNAAKIQQLAQTTRLVVVNPQAGLQGNVLLARHPDIARYWANRSADNDAALLAYLSRRILNIPGKEPIPKPIVYPAHAFYHPAAPALFDSLDAYLDWYRRRKGGYAYDPKALTLGLLIHHANVRRKDLGAWDALIAATEKRGQNAIALVGNASPDLLQFRKNGHTLIDALLYGAGVLNFNDRAKAHAQAAQLGVPILMALNHHRLSPEEYRKAPGGYIPDLAFRIVGGERDGSFEPMVVAARNAQQAVGRQQPLNEQIEWRITRALAWAKLHRAANADKKVVLTYWSEAGGKSDVGGDPDDFLDVQGTLAMLLPAMRERGYNVGKGALPDAETLAQRMTREASNMGNWAPGEIAKRVAESNPILIPEAEYSEWFNAIPEQRRKEIEAVWGPAPGKTMIYTNAQGQRFIVIPRIEYGNVLIAPHPMWGYLENQKALLSRAALPPHHQYLAFFLWLQKKWHADAWVSLFTNIVLQPGNVQGPLADDHIGILLGGLPHIHPERLGANGGTGNKRKALAALPGWYNIVVPSDSYENLGELRALIARYRSANDTATRDGIVPSLRQAIHDAGIDRALAQHVDVEHAPAEVLLGAIDTYLAELEKANMPWGGKVLGTAPQGPAMSAMVAGMLGKDLTDALHGLTDEPAIVARQLVDAVLNAHLTADAAVQKFLGRRAENSKHAKRIAAQLKLAQRHADALRQAPREVAAIFAELSGQWVEPGPMGEPFRRPEVLPPGRVLHNFDLSLVPTVEAEAIGIRQANAQIEIWRKEHHGAYPQKFAYVLWSAEIAKNNGITEAQILHMLGTRAVRNWRGEVVDVELIPREALGRPRIDVLVTTSGAYRDGYQSKVELIAKATQLAAASPEPDNPVARTTQAAEADLIKGGENAANAHRLALARVFSPAPGAYSPNIQFLAKSGDQRGGESRMADLYTQRLAHAYGGGLYGTYARPAFEGNLARTDAATLPRSSDVNGLLDHSQSAAFLGGLNLAAKALTGKDIKLYVSNLRDSANPQIESAARALQTEMRTRYFNPKWIKENMAHGYDGARNFMFLTDHLDLWDSTATHEVSSADWSEVKSVYVDDKFGLHMQEFFDNHNPFAQQMLLTNLLGAAQRGHWQASAEELASVAQKLVHSVSEHGPACEANQCRNAEMTEFVGKALATLPDAAPLLEAYQAAIAQAAAGPAPAPGAQQVSGQVVEEVQRPTAETFRATAWIWSWLAGLAAFLFSLGWWLQQRRMVQLTNGRIGAAVAVRK